MYQEIKEKSIYNDLSKPTHILLEGDNYDSLLHLQNHYINKIDVIYIDPPYNKGNHNFKYKDKFTHLEYKNFMFKRLEISKTLLTENGIIFISIDDNELAYLKLMCDDVFMEKNYIAIITWKQYYAVKNDSNHFNKQTEYILVYAKNKKQLNKIRLDIDKSARYTHDDADGKGKYCLTQLYAKSKTTNYTYYFNKWNLFWSAPIGTHPRYSIKTLELLIKNNEITYKQGWKAPRVKRYLNNVQKGIPPSTYWDGIDVGYASDGTADLSKILTRDSFINPKPISLIKHCITLGLSGKSTGIILDFFAGSGTTGHAVLELNKEDGLNRKFILCTNNENSICTDICYPRLKKVINGYDCDNNESKIIYDAKLTYSLLCNFDIIKSEIDSLLKNKNFKYKIEIKKNHVFVKQYITSTNKHGVKENLKYLKKISFAD